VAGGRRREIGGTSTDLGSFGLKQKQARNKGKGGDGKVFSKF
jgi:hypothetical protein